LRLIGIPLAINVILSWMVLPIAIPSFAGYSLRELVDVALWQGIGTVGWPLAILGWLLSSPFGQEAHRLGGSLLLTLMYPGMLILLLRALTARVLRRCELALLHMLVAFSFALVWQQILTGLDFMVG
jgi:hypothetical protein